MPSPADVPVDREQEMAAALDEALEAVQSGRPLDRTGLLARFPQLGDALAALDLVADGCPEPPEQPLPEAVGRYRVEALLGAGGFGAVYRGYDPETRRQVALKVLHPGRLDQPETLERFRREACATARLRHPGIVQLYDFTRSGPPYYLVTEYIEGAEPRDWCRRQQAGPQRIAELVGDVAEAVEHAHQMGVCHRDLKPANIVVDAAGRPHVLDFGLARMEARDETEARPTSDGRVLGSLPYMPPEQAAGNSHHADARSDVYSLGVILYELLTGRLPFDGPAHTLAARIVEEHPTPPRRLNPDIPADLEAVCLKALAKRPGDRYHSAAALARDLRAFGRGEAVQARPLSWTARVHKVLARRHQETVFHDWGPLLLAEGVTILVGCVLANAWELLLERPWAPVLLTKLAQVVVMLYLAVRLRPFPGSSGWTPAERQIWALVPAYYGGFLTLMVVNFVRPEPVPLAPYLAVLSGMGFVTLGATIWGWFYVWGAGFFALAVLITLCPPVGLGLLGLGWFVCLVVGSIHLRYTR